MAKQSDTMEPKYPHVKVKLVAMRFGRAPKTRPKCCTRSRSNSPSKRTTWCGATACLRTKEVADAGKPFSALKTVYYPIKTKEVEDEGGKPFSALKSVYYPVLIPVTWKDKRRRRTATPFTRCGPR
jgi:hypothetical protein